MPILGAGNNRREMLYQQLATLEQHLEALAQISGDRPDLDASSKELKAQRTGLTSQIKAVELLLGHPAPNVQSTASNVITKLWADQLESDDPTLAQYVRKLEQKYRPQLDLVQAGESAGVHLAPNEMDAMVALLGDTMSSAKIHAMEMLLPLMSKKQIDEGYAAVMQVSYEQGQRADAAGRWEFMTLGAGTMVPLIGTIAFSAALDAALGPFGILASVGALTLGDQLGQMVQARADATEFGVNRAEGEKVDHDLLRLAERARKSGNSMHGPKERVQRSARIEASLIGAVIELRSENSGRLGRHEKKAIESLRTYQTALESSVDKFDRDALIKARGQLLQTFPFYQAERIRTPKGETLNQMDPQAVTAGVDQLIRGTNRLVIDVTKPPLGQLVDRMEKAYDVATRIGVNSNASNEKATSAEIESLRALVGEVPSVAEFIVVARLAQAKVISVDDLWPGGTQVTLPDGGTIDGATLERALNELGDRSGAKQQERFGKTWLPIIGRLFGAGVATGIALTGVGLGFAAVAYIASAIGGSVGGKQVQKAGVKRRVLSGVDAADGRHVNSELGFLMARYATPATLPKWGTKPREALTTEAGIIRTLLASVATQLGAAKDQAEMLKTHLAAMQQQIAALPEDQRGAHEAGPLGVRAAIDTQEAQAAGIQAIHDRLATFAGALDTLVESTANDPELRTGFLRARGDLLTPAAGLDYLKSVTERSIIPEGSAHVARYVGAKGALLRQIQGLVEIVEQDAGRDLPRYRAFLKPANDATTAYKSLPKDKRRKFSEDALDALIQKVSDSPWDRATLKEFKAILEKRDEIRKDLNTGYAETAAISSDRAEGITKELLSMWSTQVFPLFGGTSTDEAPVLNVYNATVDVGQDEEGLPRYTVNATLNGWSGDSGSGKMSIVIDAEGRPQLDTLKLDVGGNNARQTARMAVSNLLDAHAKGDRVYDVVKTNPKRDGAYGVEIKTRKGDTWLVKVDEQGFVNHGAVERLPKRA